MLVFGSRLFLNNLKTVVFRLFKVNIFRFLIKKTRGNQIQTLEERFGCNIRKYLNVIYVLLYIYFINPYIISATPARAFSCRLM